MPKNVCEKVEVDTFDPNCHYYPRVLNAQIHSMVMYFLSMGNKRIVNRYCHLHPKVDPEELTKILTYQPRHFAWAGADLFHVTTEEGTRHMVVIETNSCPSGQKSMPLLVENEEQNGYRDLLQNTFKPLIDNHQFKDGVLAVIYDKNPMEASGYAAALADLMEEPVYFVDYYEECAGKEECRVRFSDDNVLEIKHQDSWLRVRAAFRYVTQRPWNRIPLSTKTLILNPVISCLAGGRNKLMAAKAYDLFNAELTEAGLEIRTPETIRDVTFAEVDLWMKKFGGHAVIKVPYSNAGQGVYTITSERELEEFKQAAGECPYNQFIIQSLIGNYTWSSRTSAGTYYHVGTVPNKQGKIFVADVRMMVAATPKGYKPLVVYGRRARKPLTADLSQETSSWDMLGTNLSIKTNAGTWDTETSRLMLMDRRDFNQLGLGIDDLIDAYIQTVLSAIAIDKMAKKIFSAEGFNKDLFFSLNADSGLLDEVCQGNKDLLKQGS